MNILLCCDLDNGGQMYSLYHALRRYTGHEAKLVTFKQTYLGYRTDIVNPGIRDMNDLVRWADFFILGEILQPRDNTLPVLRKINPRNSIVRAGGSLCRQYPHLYMSGPFKDIVKAGCLHDPTLHMKLYPVAPTVNMYHFDEWPAEKKEYEPPYRLVFSGTALKQTNEHSGAIRKAWDILGQQHSSDMVEFVNIQRKSWAESLEAKSSCHICYDQMLLGAYASSAVEGMYYRMPTFCYVSGWCKCAHPDVPLISTRSADEIVKKTNEMIDNPDEMMRIGREGHDYVVRVHSAQNAVKRWESLIDYVSDGYRR